MFSYFLFTQADAVNHEVPVWWLDFLNDNKIGISPTQLDNVLKEHKARLRTTDAAPVYGNRYLDFDTVDDAILFLLRFRR